MGVDISLTWIAPTLSVLFAIVAIWWIRKLASRPVPQRIQPETRFTNVALWLRSPSFLFNGPCCTSAAHGLVRCERRLAHDDTVASLESGIPVQVTDQASGDLVT
jgi:hypothetical protein